MKKMMGLIAAIAFSGTMAYAQPSDYEDLKGLYIDGKYAKLADKAEAYTRKDKTANDPLPYLYLAKALFKISQDEKLKVEEQYKSAEMESITYYATYVKKDKGKVYKDIADPFIAELKTQLYEEAQNFYETKNYKKAIASVKKLLKIEPENIGINLVKGLSELGVKNKTEAKINIDNALKAIKNIQSIETMMDADKQFFKYGIIQYAEYLMQQKDKSGAKSAITLGHQYFYNDNEENADFKEAYDRIAK